MQRKRMKKFHLRRCITTKDNEGNLITAYGDALTDYAVIWPAGGKVQAEMYGLRLAYMININYYGYMDIKENDGLCINAGKYDEPDYRVISIKEYSKFRFIEAEKRIA